MLDLMIWIGYLVLLAIAGCIYLWCISSKETQ